MKRDEIDIQLLLDLIYQVPDGYDIDNIDLSHGSIKLQMSFDYKGEFERVQAAQREATTKAFQDDYQTWAKRFEDYQNKVEQGIIKPDKRIGWERQLAACYDKQLALEVAKEIEELNKPKKRGRPRKDKTALPSAV